MTYTKTYKSQFHAAAAYVRAGKANGTVTSLGGGWFRADALSVRNGSKGLLQGFGVVAHRLKALGLLAVLPDGRATLEWRGESDPGVRAANRAFARSVRVED